MDNVDLFWANKVRNDWLQINVLWGFLSLWICSPFSASSPSQTPSPLFPILLFEILEVLTNRLTHFQFAHKTIVPRKKRQFLVTFIAANMPMVNISQTLVTEKYFGVKSA